MPYTAQNAPEAVKALPQKAMDIWISAFNSAFGQYDGDESKSAATAWAAIKKAGYSKNEKTGKWTIKEAVFVEAKDSEGKIWEVVLIQSGMSKNGHNYPPEVLQASAHLFEGARALSRSDEDHLAGRDKSAKNIVGWFSKVRYENGSIIGEFHVSEAAAWLKTMLKDAWDSGKKDLIGFSIVAEGTVKKDKKRGFLTVESIDRVESVDVVVNPAAGGRILKLVAAQKGLNDPGISPGKNVTEEEMKKLLKLLESKRPDLYKKIDPEKVTEEEIVELLAEAIELAKQQEGNDNNKDSDQSFQDNEGSELLTEARKLAAEAKAEREKTEKTIKIAECRSILTEKLAESELPELSRSRIKKRFEGQIFETSTLEEEIKSEREYIAKLSESGRINGLGGFPQVGPGEVQKTMLALDGFFAGSDLKEGETTVPRFKSFREAYVSITGDSGITGSLREATRLKKFTEALTTASWAQILGDSITRRMLAEYRVPGLDDWRKITSDITSIKDFRTNRRMRMGGYGTVLPAVAQAGTYNALTSPGDEEATFAISKRGGLETITMEMIANDDVGAIRRIPRRLARNAAITLYRFVMDFILNNGATTYDAVALFHASHGNLGAAALSATSLLAAKVAMADQAAYGNAIEIMGLTPKYLLVPNELEDLAFRLTISRSSIGSAEGTPRYADTEPNIHASYGLTPILVPYWTDANDWALVCNPMDCPTLEIGFLNGREEPELFVQDQETTGSMFTNDQITYKIRHIYGGAVLDHRGMYKAVVA